jgi:hypothetical protein
LWSIHHHLLASISFILAIIQVIEFMGFKSPTSGLYLCCSKVTFVGIEGLKILSNLGGLPIF